MALPAPPPFYLCNRLATATALVTLVTIHAVVHISAHVRMAEIVCVSAAMTLRALEHRVVAWVRVAGRAHPVGVAVVGREVSVIERRTRPGGGGMARSARRREARRSVVRIRRAVVVGLVAADASGRQCRVVVVDVAHHTSHGRSRMEASKREGRVVVIKGRARPVRGAMADIAGRWEAGARVGRRIGVVVVGLMARNAGRVRGSQSVVPVHVALRAGHREMEARERKPGRRMVKRAAAPVGRGVALIACRREPCLRVIRSRGPLVVLQMALGAGPAGETVVVIHVALRAGERGMEPGQCEARGCVIKGGRRPVCRAVAGLASLRETSRSVRRIRGAVEISQVAADASRVRGGQVVIAIHVALRALHGGMEARQREAGGRVIERRIAPRRGAMALLAGLREVRLHVIGVRCALEVGQMAAHASRIRAGQVVVVVHMALRTLQRSMCARQREAGGRVIEGRVQPAGCAVALLTSLRES